VVGTWLWELGAHPHPHKGHYGLSSLYLLLQGLDASPQAVRAMVH
jgi:hypothetical protein